MQPGRPRRPGRQRLGIATGRQAARPTSLSALVRPTAAQLAAAVAERAVVADVVAPGLDVLFCGINPGRWSGAVGHHFAHPGNRFWKALQLSGFTDTLLVPAEERRLLDFRLGITNLVARTTAAAAELSPDELRAGAERLERLVEQIVPKAVAFLGLGAYRTAFRSTRVACGPQDATLAGVKVWVLPNPSGLQARYGLPELAEMLRALRTAVGPASGGAEGGTSRR